MRRFYAPPENFSDQQVTLDSEESRHLRDVLRLRAGTEAAVFDGAGNEFRCRIETIGKRETRLTIIEKISPRAPESNLDLTLAIGLLKGEKFDLAVQKCCELGVSSLVPLVTARADVRIRDARETEKKLERWRRISIEAAKQSGRARSMHVAVPLSFEKFLQTAEGTRILFAEKGGAGFAGLSTRKFSMISAAIGSEGGWEDSEIEAARDGDFQIITLGGRILRAETAAITIAALLQNHFGDLT